MYGGECLTWYMKWEWSERRAETTETEAPEFAYECDGLWGDEDARVGVARDFEVYGVIQVRP